MGGYLRSDSQPSKIDLQLTSVHRDVTGLAGEEGGVILILLYWDAVATIVLEPEGLRQLNEGSLHHNLCTVGGNSSANMHVCAQ